MELNILLNKLGTKIRILRMAKKISQEKFSELTEMDRGYLGQIERGEANFSMAILNKIAVALDIDVAELFNFTI